MDGVTVQLKVGHKVRIIAEKSNDFLSKHNLTGAIFIVDDIEVLCGI